MQIISSSTSRTLEPCSLPQTLHGDRRGVRLYGLEPISLQQDLCSIYTIGMLVLTSYHLVDDFSDPQTCVTSWLGWQYLPQRKPHHFSNVQSTPSRSPPNTLAMMLHGTRTAFHTLNAPTPKSRTCTTTDGRSSELTNVILESVATFPPVCSQPYLSLVTSNKADMQCRRVPRRCGLATGALGVTERCDRLPHRRREMAS
jgi:hypothetical protein